MRFFIRFLAIFITAVLLIVSTVCVAYSTGWLSFLFVLAFGGIVLLATVITQVILFLTIRGCRSLLYDYFFFSSFTSSLLLLQMYYFFSVVMNSLNEMSSLIAKQSSDAISDVSSGTPEPIVLTSSGYFGYHLFFFVPIFIQIILTIFRSKQLKLLSQRDKFAINQQP